GSGGGFQAERLVVSGGGNPGYSGAGNGSVLYRYSSRCVDGKTDEPDVKDSDQSADRFRRCVRRADGGAGVQQGGSGSQSTQLPVDACHGAQCGGGDRIGGGGGNSAEFCRLNGCGLRERKSRSVEAFFCFLLCVVD